MCMIADDLFDLIRKVLWRRNVFILEQMRAATQPCRNEGIPPMAVRVAL